MNEDRLMGIINRLFPDKSCTILISACLLGINCTYDNSNNQNELLIKLAKYRKLLPICPEQLGGLPTPREPQNITKGTGDDVLNGKARIVNEKKIDVTEKFLKATIEIERLLTIYQIKYAILKDKSPSCGVHHIYNKEIIIPGQGVTTAYLKRNGIEIFSEKDVKKAFSNKTISD